MKCIKRVTPDLSKLDIEVDTYTTSNGINIFHPILMNYIRFELQKTFFCVCENWKKN